MVKKYSIAFLDADALRGPVLVEILRGGYEFIASEFHAIKNC